jgi:hypothetical protein
MTQRQKKPGNLIFINYYFLFCSFQATPTFCVRIK